MSAPCVESDAGCGGNVFALLLNDTTKGEDEEYLDYHFPVEGAELQALLPMKGVLLASCGVMRTAVGQDVAFFVFRSASNPRLQYKACFHKLDHWFLCLVLPGAASDKLARCLVDEAANLIALKHGRLSSLDGHFRQLDPIFRALSNLWRSIGQGCNDDGDVAVGNVYLNLGVVLWSSLADGLHQDVQARVAQWESKWAASTDSVGATQPLAQPEGFALLLGQTLVATSLADVAFDACLKLLVLHGALDSGGGGSFGVPSGSNDDADVRCHSLFLVRNDEASTVGPLPSHQYSIIQQGPWLLFMMWRMSSATSPKLSSSAERAVKPVADSFGVDLCLELLNDLPSPQGHVASQDAPTRSASGPLPSCPSPVTGVSSLQDGKPRDTPPAADVAAAGAASQQGKQKKRSSLKLSCPLFRKSSKKQTPDATTPSSGSRPPRPDAALASRPPRGIFLQGLQMQDNLLPQSFRAQDQPNAFAITRTPRRAARDHLPVEEVGRVRCAEVASRAAARRCQPWSSWGLCELLGDWSELAWLADEHRARRAAWTSSPRLTANSRHALVDVLKGGGALDKLWEECAEELGITNSQSVDRHTLRKGEAWRFQAGAPYRFSDISPVRSIGMRSGVGQHRTWAVLSGLRCASSAEAPRRVFLQFDGMGEAA